MKKCPMCAEDVQDEARVCRFCKHDFTRPVPRPVPDNWINRLFPPGPAAPQRQRQPVGCGGVLAICVGLVVLVAWCSGDPKDQLTEATTTAAAPTPEILPETTVAKCREMLATGKRTGIIRARPEPNRIDVEDGLWAQLDSATKDRTLQAVACAVWKTAMPGPADYVVAYGYRSGKRLQMLTSVGMSRE